MVGRAGNGIDNIDVDACTRYGVIVANTPDSNTISAAEQTIALMLASSRKTVWANNFLKGVPGIGNLSVVWSYMAKLWELWA